MGSGEASNPAVKIAEIGRILAANVRSRRLELKLTASAAAELAGLNIRHWQKVEYEDVNLTLNTLVRVAVALQKTVRAILRAPGAAAAPCCLASASGAGEPKRMNRAEAAERIRACMASSRGALAWNVKRRRRELGLKMSGAAKRAGMAVNHWSRMEGERRNPTLKTLVAVANALESDLSELLSIPEEREQVLLVSLAAGAGIGEATSARCALTGYPKS